MRWKIFFATAVIFMAGIFTGSILTREFAPRVVTTPAVSSPLPIAPDRRLDYLERLNREVQLTPEQRAEIEKIIGQSQERLRALWEPVAPKAREEYRATRREIIALLTSEQKEALQTARRARATRENAARSNSQGQSSP